MMSMGKVFASRRRFVTLLRFLHVPTTQVPQIRPSSPLILSIIRHRQASRLV